MVNIVLVGPPGCGKGTQAELLEKEYNIPAISTGNILRHAIEEKTSLGLKAKQAMDAGELVPDVVVDAIITERIRHSDCKGGFILDGFPRDLAQAKALEQITQIDVVVDIRLSEAEVIKRIGMRRVCDCGQTYHLLKNPPKKTGICDECGCKIRKRADDCEKTIRKRLKIYHAKTEPLTSYFRQKGALYEVDGDNAIEQVFKQIKGALKPFFPSKT